MAEKYVPILKWKRGEQIALEHLDDETKEKIVPLIEIPPIEYDYINERPKKTITQHILNVPSQINTHFGNRKVFLDLVNIYEEDLLQDGIHSIEYIINESSDLNLDVVPVVSSNSNDEYSTALQELIDNGKVSELCIRIEEGDFLNLNILLEDILNLYNVSSDQCHLVVDLKEITESNIPTYEITVPLLINNLAHQNQWISITLASTSFPKTLERVARNSNRMLPRIEFRLWNNINARLTRKIQFGDYCIANPEYIDVDPRYMGMSGNIRYTIQDYYLVYKGVNAKNYGFQQMVDMCTNLINSQNYCGNNFSWGDRYIYDVANRTQNTGNAETWRRVGTNHHIVFVVNELSNLSYF